MAAFARLVFHAAVIVTGAAWIAVVVILGAFVLVSVVTARP